MKAEEIRGLTDQELSERIEGERMHLQSLRMSHAVTPLENAMELRESKRVLARLLTIAGERKRASVEGAEQKQ